MKKSSRKFAKIALCAMILTMFTSTVAFAKSYVGIYVFGATYSVVADGSFDNSSNYVTVTLTKILKSDGTSSDYSTVREDVLDTNGNQISSSTGVAINLQQSTNIMLKQNYSAGTRMKLRMKGNVSSLDCIVDFTAPIS